MDLSLDFVALFAVATGVAVASRRFDIPYTVALVLAGLVLGSTHAIEPPHLGKDLLYGLILPGLLFEAAYHVEFRRFWRNKIAIHTLAIPGLLAAVTLTAFLVHAVTDSLGLAQGFSLQYAFVFAALIAATDPIAVVGLFKTLGAPKRMAVLVEGESLVNDGVAVVIFSLAVAHATGHPLSAPQAFLEFIKVAGIGIVVGALVGVAISYVIGLIDDPMLEITLTVIAAFGSFALAEAFHCSGVLATVSAGLFCGNRAANTGMGPTTRIAVESFWQYVAFALNSIVFLLIGIEIDLATLLGSWKAIVVAFVAVLAARAVVVFVVTAILRTTRERLASMKWASLLTWSGLRGALSMVLVLGLAADFPHRAFLVNLTFGVVLLSIVTQGLSMRAVMRKLGFVQDDDSREAYDLARARLMLAHCAHDELAKLKADPTANAEVLSGLSEEYAGDIDLAKAALDQVRENFGKWAAEERLALHQHIVASQKAALLSYAHEGNASAKVVARLTTELDQTSEALRQQSQ